jgi:hypothetical protein
MNTRILELAKQATAQYCDLSDASCFKRLDLVEAVVFKPEDLERFAFLIIRECMRQVEEQYQPVLEDQVMMKDTHWDGYVQCGVDSYVAIREHFYGEQE